MKNKRILIAGGAGSIGSELTRILCKENKIFILDYNETGVFQITQELKKYWVKPRVGDIRDRETIRDLFEDFKPQIVINAAALKHVQLSQIYPRDYVETNIIGNLNLIEEAKKWECLEKYVFISSDKVHSKSIMGITKKCSEAITVSNGKGFLAVRFGNVIGSRGSLISVWEDQINSSNTIAITDSRMERYFMTISEACELVIKAAEDGQGGEIYILDMGRSIKIKDLAETIVKNLSLGTTINTIGIRPGEVLEERLMSAEEEKIAIKKDKFFIIK